MYSVFWGTEAPQQCEDGSEAEVEATVSERFEVECHQNGDRGHIASPEEGERKPEEEHDSGGSADSPGEGEQ